MTIPKQLRLEFVTPERVIAHEEVDELVLPGEGGYFGVLPGHTPLLAALAVGDMWYRIGSEKFHVFVDGGYAEVMPDRVSVLARVAERAEDIDLERAAAARRRAEDRLAKPVVSEIDFERARIALLRAVSRMDVARYARRRTS